MKRQRQFDKILYGILSILLIVFVFVTIVFAMLSNTRKDSEKISLWDKGWILMTPDGKEEAVTIPSGKIHTDEYVIKSVLPRNLESNDYLFIWVNNQKIKVYVNGATIFSYEPVYEKYINKNLSAEQYLLIPIPFVMAVAYLEEKKNFIKKL